jgi:hypothetical protein
MNPTKAQRLESLSWRRHRGEQSDCRRYEEIDFAHNNSNVEEDDINMYCITHDLESYFSTTTHCTTLRSTFGCKDVTSLAWQLALVSICSPHLVFHCFPEK